MASVEPVLAWRAAPEPEYMLRLNTLLHFFVHWRVNTGRRRKEDLCLNRWVQRHRAVWYLGRTVCPSQPIGRWGFLFHFLVYMHTHVLRVRRVAHPNSCLCCQTFITAGNECAVLLLLRTYWTDGATEHFTSQALTCKTQCKSLFYRSSFSTCLSRLTALLSQRMKDFVIALHVQQLHFHANNAVNCRHKTLCQAHKCHDSKDILSWMNLPVIWLLYCSSL